MKKETKRVALLEIAVVLCSVFLVAIPAIAAEQNQEMQKASTSTITTASEDDYVLGVYGNANEDDTIDMRDLTYVKLIFFGKKPETELADAKYDGKINPLDFIQIKLIIVGKEKELTIVDQADRIVTVKKPVERIIVLNYNSGEALKILGESDKVVGIINKVTTKSYYFPEMSKKPIVGTWSAPDYEATVALTPDIVICYTGSSPSKYEEHLEPAGITVVALSFYKRQPLLSEVERLGYILNKRIEAEEFIDWYKEHEDKIKSLVDGLPEEEKPRVFIERGFKGLGAIRTMGHGSVDHDRCVMAGGINIAGDMPGRLNVEWEWVIRENPDVIITEKYTEPSWGWDNIDAPKGLIDDIKSRPGAGLITAVEKNEVYACCQEPLNGLDSIVGLTYWAKLLHPEFDLDPEGIYKEYAERFLSIEYPEDLILVYPPPAS